MTIRPLALALLTLTLVGCGGVRVYRAPDSSSKDNPIDGIPFVLKTTKIQTTSYYGVLKSEWTAYTRKVAASSGKAPKTPEGRLLYSVSEAVSVPDYSTYYVVEASRNYGNPFEVLETTTKLNPDGTLSEFAYKSDPQLDEAVKAVTDGAKNVAGLFEGKTSDLPPSLLDQVVVLRVEVTHR